MDADHLLKVWGLVLWSIHQKKNSGCHCNTNTLWQYPFKTHHRSHQRLRLVHQPHSSEEKTDWTGDGEDVLCLLEKMKRKISISSMFIPYPAFHRATGSVSQSFYVAHSRSSPISCLEMRAPVSVMASDRSVWEDGKQSALKSKIKLEISYVTYWGTSASRGDGAKRQMWRAEPQTATAATRSSSRWGGLI